MKRALLVALLAFAGIGTAGAFTVNSVSYKDSESSFKWTLKITFGAGTGLFTVTPVDPDGQMDWTMTAVSDDVEGDGMLNDLVIAGKHLHGPHDLDVDPGLPFSFTFSDVPDMPPVPNPEPVLPVKAGTETVDHLHTPVKHMDIVDLFIVDATKSGGFYTDLTILVQGVHVPEPMGAAVLLTAAAGLLLRGRRRR